MAKLKILPKRFDILDANDPNCSFRINIDILNECFGANRSIYMNATYPQRKTDAFLGTKEGDQFRVWMPKLYGNSSEWINRLVNDGKTISEVAEKTRHIDWTEDDRQRLVDCLRLVFVKPSATELYRFVGVFEKEKMDRLNHSYKRIATKVRLIGNPVTQIELLDDERDNPFLGYDFNDGKVFSRKSRNEIKEITDMFPMDHIINMDLNDYCLSPKGHGYDNSFCRQIRYRGACSMGNAFPAAFDIYKDKEGNIKMSPSLKKEFGDNYSWAFSNIKARIITFLEAARKKDTVTMNEIKLNTQFKQKLAAIYYCDTYFPTATKEYTRQACLRLGVIYDEENMFNSMLYLVDWRDRYSETKDFTPAEIMWFAEYLIRNDLSMTSEQIGENPYKKI